MVSDTNNVHVTDVSGVETGKYSCCLHVTYDQVHVYCTGHPPPHDTLYSICYFMYVYTEAHCTVLYTCAEIAASYPRKVPVFSCITYVYVYVHIHCNVN